MRSLNTQFFLFFYLMGGFCYAQQKQYKLEKDSLVWTKKKQIYWKDSTDKIINSLSFNCYVYSSFESVASKKNLNQPSRVRVNFEYDRKSNFTIEEDIESSDYLYSQTVLNIHQLYAKKLRKVCFQLKFKPGYHALFESAFVDYFEQMVKRDNAMRLETENGKNISKLNEWSDLILKELEEGSTKEK